MRSLTILYVRFTAIIYLILTQHLSYLTFFLKHYFLMMYLLVQTVHCSQLDNNNFAGTVIPASYGTMPKLLKLYVVFSFS